MYCVQKNKDGSSIVQLSLNSKSCLKRRLETVDRFSKRHKLQKGKYAERELLSSSTQKCVSTKHEIDLGEKEHTIRESAMAADQLPSSDLASGEIRERERERERDPPSTDDPQSTLNANNSETMVDVSDVSDLTRPIERGVGSCDGGLTPLDVPKNYSYKKEKNQAIAQSEIDMADSIVDLPKDENFQKSIHDARKGRGRGKRGKGSSRGQPKALNKKPSSRERNLSTSCSQKPVRLAKRPPPLVDVLPPPFPPPSQATFFACLPPPSNPPPLRSSFPSLPPPNVPPPSHSPPEWEDRRYNPSFRDPLLNSNTPMVSVFPVNSMMEMENMRNYEFNQPLSRMNIERYPGKICSHTIF